MGFIRNFDDEQMQKMTLGKNAELFVKLKNDILNGKVFATVRKNQMHFYYKGGCLYKFSGGSFYHNKEFEKYGAGFEYLDPYEKAKKEVEIKFTSVSGKDKERALLDSLNFATFKQNNSDNVVVIDIEVNLNGTVSGGKKCDLVLLNKHTNAIMFVEGKVFWDSRVNVALSFMPKVISQVHTYTEAIAEQRQVILEQYARHIDIINKLFGVSYNPPKKLVEPAKLLVYNTPKRLTKNGKYSMDKINAELGACNVLWVEENDNPSLNKIWEELCK